MVCICYSMVGIPIFLIAIANLAGTMTNLIKGIYSCVEQGIKKLFTSKKKLAKQNSFGEEIGAIDLNGELNKDAESSNQVVNSQETDDEDESEDDELEDNKKAHSKRKITVIVPLIFVLAIIVGYMAIGAVVYSLLEPTWTKIPSAYFTFVTIATIGTL